MQKSVQSMDQLIASRFYDRFAAGVALGTCALLLLLRILPANFDFLTEHGIRQVDASTSAVVDEGHGGFPSGRVPLAIIRTSLAIAYQDKVSSGASVVVEVTLSQEEQVETNHKGIHQAEPITHLRWPIDVSLTLDGKTETKHLTKQAPLPAHLVWASSLGSGSTEVVAVLRATNDFSNDGMFRLNTPFREASADELRVVVNGETSTPPSSDDIKLPILVYRYGMPAWLWEFVSLGGTVVSFALGCAFITGAVSRLWAWITGHSSTQHDT